MEIDENIVTSEADEKREQERLSTLATFGILAATIAATIAGSLAALASVHGDDANSSRVAWATYSNEQLLAYNQYAFAHDEGLSTHREDAWRARVLEDLADDTSDPTLRAEFGTEALQASGYPNAGTAPRLSFASPNPVQLCRGLGQPYDDCAYEASNAYATISLDDNRQERAYIACVSMLAIALFLFALSKMLSQPSMERMFLVLGTVITLIAVGWMVAEQIVTPATRPSTSAIRAYETGWQHEQQGGRPARVEALFRTATTEDPSMVDAWQQLGEEELLHPRPGTAADRCRTAIAALTRARALRGAADDVDRLAVGQVLCGDPSRALATMRAAPADPSDLSAGPAVALAELALGHTTKALQTLDAAASTMEYQGRGVQGPIYRTYWFDQLRTDVRALAAPRDPPRGMHRFTERMLYDEDVATLADYGLDLPAPSPDASVHATRSVATATLGSADGLVPVAIDLTYSGLSDGDVIAVTWDQTTTVEGIRQISSLPLPGTSVVVVGQPGGPTAGSGTFVIPGFDFVAPGEYQLDVSLDAVPTNQRAAVITIPQPQPNAGPRPVPLVVPKPPPPPAAPPPTTTTTINCKNPPTTTSTTSGELPIVFTC